MGRKPKKKDIAEYLWHSEPTKINATNDNWRIRYGYLDSEGKEHQTTETVNNERAKNQFVSYLLLREKEHKAAKGTTVASKVDKTEIETVEQLLYAYAEHTKYLHTIGDRYGWDEGTYRANIGKIRNYIVPVFGSFPIWKITRVDMRQGFKDMLQLPQANGNHKANGARVSQRTVYDCKKIISRAFKYATDDLELITENPMLGVTVKQPKSGRREVWTEEQFNFAYDNCSDPQLKLLISLMIALSSRIGECLALTWSDVYDNEDKHEPSYIRVYKQLVYRSEEFIEETNGRGILKVFDQVRSTRPDAKRRAVFHVTKTEKEIEAKTDRIYVAPEVIFMLRDYKLVQNQHKQRAGDSYIDDDLIFAHEDGTHISSQYADDMFSALYKPLGLPRVDLYMPILGDLMNALLSQHIPEADRVAQALDLYVNGSLNFFNHRTTVDISNRLVCFDIKGLGKNLKKPGMLIVQDAVWNTVTINRAIGRSTWYFVDEFHLLLKEEQTAAYSAEIWKRFRKWGGIPTGATQNPKDLLSSPEIENILENSDFIYMLNQAAGDRKILAERLNISSEQLAYVTNSEPGHGLLFFNNVILPFADDFPKDTELYKLLTTKPSEVMSKD